MTTPSIPSTPPKGRIDVAENAIASIVQAAVTSTYGIVGTAPRSLGSSLSRRFGRSNPRQGIDIHVLDNAIAIELSVIVEYGTPIFTVARNLMASVKFQVERSLGMPVERVDVTIQGLRVSTEPAR